MTTVASHPLIRAGSVRNWLWSWQAENSFSPSTWILLISSLVIYLPGVSAQAVRGIITDDIGDSPVSGALVRAIQGEEVRASAESGRLGQSSLSGLTSGEYVIEVSRLGYQTAVSQTLVLEGGEEKPGHGFTPGWGRSGQRARRFPRDSLDHVIVLNERHLLRVLRSYASYYHASRTHRSLDDDCPEPRPIEPADMGKVVAQPQVGGLHHRYGRQLAA